MNNLFLVFFIFVALVHLYASFTKNTTLRAISKPALLPSLLFIYIHSVTNPSILLCFAILFSWLGDLFLIPKSLKSFTCGGISFMISHLLFIFSYLETYDVSSISWYIYVIFGLVYSFASIFSFIKLRKHLKKQIKIPVLGYLLINGAMNCFAIYRYFALGSIASLITMIGAVLFFISDVILFFVRFDKNCKMKSHFWVMIFYLLGELLIVLGFVL